MTNEESKTGRAAKAIAPAGLGRSRSPHHQIWPTSFFHVANLCAAVSGRGRPPKEYAHGCGASFFQSSSEAVSLSEPIVLEKDGEAAAAAGSNPKVLAAPTEKAIGHTDVSSANPLALAIDKLFEPARQCQQRLREITQSCDVINQLARSTLELCQPLRNFGDRLRKLSKAFLAIRTFRDELNILAESFRPIAILNKQIVQLEGAIQAEIAEMAMTPESTKTLRARIAELEQSADSSANWRANSWSYPAASLPLRASITKGSKSLDRYDR